MATYTQLGINNPDGMKIGAAATDKVGFYGTTPIAQRAAAVQANSVVSVSSNITIAASLTAWIVEVTATLNALGLWKGAAEMPRVLAVGSGAEPLD